MRERDGNLEKLLSDFERRAEQPDDTGYAALLALAGLYREDSKPDQAIAAYRRALTQKPKDPAALIALGHMLAGRGNQRQAKEQFERALPLVSDAAEREQLLRLLMTLSLDLKDYDAAKRHHEELVRRSHGSFHVRGLLGQELLARGVYDRAVKEFEELVRHAAGDYRALAPALRDLGRAQAELGDNAAALATLEKALAIAGGQTGIRREVLELIVGVYRSQDRLRELVQKLERQPARDFETLRLLGALYEEIGRIDKAVETYQRALALNRNDLGTRIKLVQLLQIRGELDQAISEYEALIRAAPHNPDFVFQLAEALIQRGERDRALAELKRLEARSHEEDVLVALVDFYERVGEKDRSLRVLQRLGQTHSTDPTHLVELGSRYWDRGEKKKALQTWERIRVVVGDRAAALHRLGEVYLEHDLVDDALKSLRQAIELRPGEPKYKKAYAQALERTATGAKSRGARLQQYEAARRIWEELLAGAKSDDPLAAEARRHIVTLWSLSGRPELRVAPLERRFGQTPPDIEAGKLLAELELRLGNVARAETTLRKLVELAPGDVASLLSLEQVLVRRRKLDEAIGVLKRLAAAEPRRAREFYQRMAKYAGELYRDDDAMKYAERAVELSPDDAEAHRKLGEMYRQRQDVERAIAAFRRALSKNDRLFPVYFELAELLLSKGENDEADRLLRRVIRASPDEELVARAARLSMQINLGRGSLESLEKELLPLALSNPGRPLYRRLLVEIYGALAFPLVQHAESGSPEEAERARQELGRLGERAVKPLLDALGDEQDAQQRVAIELLSHIQNKSAGPSLFAYATSEPASIGIGSEHSETELRARAMIAAGTLRDPELLPKLEELLTSHGRIRADESNPIHLAAAWSVAYLASERARGLLERLLEGDAPSVSALAALGLAKIGDRRAVDTLLERVGSEETSPLTRAAAARALAELGVERAGATIARLLEATHPLLRAVALESLALLHAASAPRAIAEGLVDTDAAVRNAALAAALTLATGQARGRVRAWRPPDHYVDVQRLLSTSDASAYSADERGKALVLLADELRAAASAAAQSSPGQAAVVARALLARGGRPAFGALSEGAEGMEAKLRLQVEQEAAQIGAAVVEPFVALASHPAADVRSMAVEFLASRSDPAAELAVGAALTDSNDAVQQAALAAVARFRVNRAAPAVAALLAPRNDWHVRMHAARTLGALDAVKSGAAPVRALARAARDDPYALVREQALRSLAALDPEAGRRTARELARRDPEPRVVAFARSLLDSEPESASPKAPE